MIAISLMRWQAGLELDRGQGIPFEGIIELAGTETETP